MPGIQFTFEVNDTVSSVIEGIAGTAQKAFDNDKTVAKFNAGLGQSVKITEQMGELARKVWTEGYGESLGDVTAALGEVGSQMVDLGKTSPAEVEKLTKGALDLATVMGADVVEVTRAAGQMMKNGLAPDAQTAFDIIATGAQNGANRSGDLLDTFSQYSGNFAELGLSGQQALDMINGSLDAGIFTTDVAADAMREFGTRVTDGSAQAAGAFDALGLNADEMKAKIAAGGPTAQQATGQIFTALGQLTDPVQRETTGVALFGSMWEDMGGKAIMAMDPTITKTQDVSGATEEMGNKLSDVGTTKIESIKRKFDDWFQSMITAKGPLGEIMGMVAVFGGPALTLAGNVSMIAIALRGTALAAGAAAFGMGALSLAATPIAIIAAALLAVIALIKTAIDQIDNLKRNWQGLTSGNLGQMSNLGTFSNLGRKPTGGFLSLPGHAAGGLVTRPHLAMVGEGGEPELITPLSKVNEMLAAAGGGSGESVMINVYGSVIHERDLARTVVDAVAKARRTGAIPVTAGV